MRGFDEQNFKILQMKKPLFLKLKNALSFSLSHHEERPRNLKPSKENIHHFKNMEK
jgi:hypothetical protein